MPSIVSDKLALQQAIQEGVTRNKNTNAGNGLYGAFRAAQISNGKFSIYSGYAELRLNPYNGETKFLECDVPYNGTSIVCGIKYNDSQLLAKALKFKNEIHISSNSIVDKYENMDIVSINVINEVNSFGSRDVARSLKTKLLNVLNNTDVPVMINMSGINLISSSFADEIFGMIFSEIGPMKFMSKIKIIGSNDVVDKLIDRAITQRMVRG